MVQRMDFRAADDGDSAAFVTALVRHQRRIYLFIASLLPNPSDVEDVYQQTCVALWNKRAELPQVRDFFAWACGFARNEVLHQIRSNSRSRHLYLPDDLLATLAGELEQDLAHDDDRLLALTNCLARLQPPQRGLLERAYQGVESIKDIAEELKISAAALTMRLQRIRHALLKCIELTLAGSGPGGTQ
ncbi:MAG: polymerase sigma-E factor [Planctomycetota bacterium]|jgi:RNA polymerase sigma-70 factor (ECF subfamily)